MRLDELFLREYDEKKTLDVFRNKLIGRLKQDTGIGRDFEWDDEHSVSRLLTDVMREFAAVDPTPNQMYTQWLVRLYANSGIETLEDLSDATDVLVKFDDLRKRGLLKPEDKDINKLKSLDGLRTIVSAYGAVKSGKQATKELSQEFINTGAAEVIYDDPTMKVVIPRTEEASCFFGQGTKWCTAGREDNKFEDYSGGNLYIIAFKGTPHKWQFTAANDEYTDEANKPLSASQLLDILTTVEKWMPPKDFIKMKKSLVSLIQYDEDASEVLGELDDHTLVSLYKAEPTAVYEHAGLDGRETINLAIRNIKRDELKPYFFYKDPLGVWILNPAMAEGDIKSNIAWGAAVAFKRTSVPFFFALVSTSTDTPESEILVADDVESPFFRYTFNSNGSVAGGRTVLTTLTEDSFIAALEHIPESFWVRNHQRLSPVILTALKANKLLAKVGPVASKRLGL